PNIEHVAAIVRSEGVPPVQSVPSPSPSRVHLQCNSSVVVNASFNPPLAETNFAVSSGVELLVVAGEQP
ncbi:hypothetical protein B296_00052371, partial [Ensete ventricosum]